MAKRPPRGEGITRRRILEAAIKRFSEHSYDDTSLRDIANDVGVDVAYVHRSFGSKENLFLEALQAASQEMDLSEMNAADVPRYLVRGLFAEPRGRLVLGISALDIIVHSLSSPQVSRFLGQRMLADFLTPLAKKLDDPEAIRVSMMMSLVIGFGVIRDFLQLQSLATLAPSRAEQILTQAIQQILSSHISPERDG